MSPLGNEEARAQVGTNGGLSQRWHEQFERLSNARFGDGRAEDSANHYRCRANELDAAKLHIEEAVKALGVQFAYDAAYDRSEVFFIDRDAVLKIIREIL